jgi:hypothetical protein
MTAAAKLRALRRRADRLDEVERLLRGLEIERRMAALGHPRPRTRHTDEPGRVLHPGPECWGDKVWVRRV